MFSPFYITPSSALHICCLPSRFGTRCSNPTSPRLILNRFIKQLTIDKEREELIMASTLSRSQFQRSIASPALRSYLAEFISTFLYVFAAVGSAMSARKVTSDATSDAASLVATALAQGFMLFAAVYVSSNASGGHVNPAVTFGLALGGYIDIPTAVFYWISQLTGSTLACLLLHVATPGQAIPTTGIAAEMTGFGGAVLEVVITFALVYTVYAATVHPGNNNSKDVSGSGTMMGVVGPMAIGLVAGACVLAAGSFTGASMNPARSFGPAMISGDFKNHGVYWVGPLIGAALAALVHQILVYPPSPFRPSADPAHGGVVEVI